MKKAFIISTVLFLTTISAFAQDFNVYKLNNGQTVVIEEVKTNPIVTIDTWIKTGSINEDDKNNGVSHFLEHLFFKGSLNHAPGEFDKILETKGAINNAATSKDFTHYYITIPSKDFDLALEMHSDMLLNPLIPRKEMEKERKVVLEEIAKDMNNPNSIVYENLVKMMYTTHPYKRKVIGTSNIIETITRDKIMEYYNRFYKPSNMVTVVVGDVNSDKILEKIKKDFNKDYEKPEKITYPKEKPLTKQERTIQYFPVTSGYMLIGFRSVKIDDKGSYALDVLATILGEGRTSILYKNIKEDKQLAYSISASNTGFKDDGIFYISANFTPEKFSKLETEIFSQIKQIQKNGVTQEQLNTAKNMIERETFYERESISNIANEIGYVFVTTDDTKYYKTYVDNIKKVSTSDIKKVANKYLGQQNSAVSILLPEENKNAEIKISNTTSSQDTKFISSYNGTEKYELENGTTLLYTDNKINDIVAGTIMVKGGEFLEEKPGTASLMNAVLLKGTKKYTKDELANLLEDNGIKISPSSSGDSLTITILTTRNEYNKTLDILHEILNNATLDDYEIDKAKTEKLSRIKKNRDIPINVALEEYKTLIYEGSPYSNSPKVLEKSLPQITQEDIENYYHTIFNPKNIVVSINGNIDKEKTIQAFSTMFNSENQNSKFDYQNCKNITNIKSPKISTKEIKDLKTDWLILGWQTDGLTNKKDWATLQVIDTILGTGMSSRMFKNIRDNEGLAYQLGSQYSPNMLKGMFLMYIGTNPENLTKAKDKMFKEIYTLKREFVSTKELNDAKEKLIGRYILSQETNLDKASTVGWFETSNRGFDFDKDYTKLIKNVTETDIIEVANKYFNDNYVLSIVKEK